jgi:Na+/melibiose symporter-like transporter
MSLPATQRARGRWLAWTSHPAGMTHRYAYMADLPTLALLSLGAGESVVGLQRAFERIGQLIQLPTLRAVGVVRKRTILVTGQALAVLGGLPLVAFAWLAAQGDAAVPIALASLAVATVGMVIGQTVWFPLLRSYVEPNQIGRFFGILRTGWHLTLIAYFLAAQQWLSDHPGSFGLLFGAATALGVVRIVLVARLPEAEGERGTRVRAREALALLRSDLALRRYLIGMGLAGASHRAALPFVIVWMRRVMGLSEGEVLLATVAQFAGGLVSLYLWGRMVDRFGPWPVFRTTGIAMAVLFCALVFVPETPALTAMIVFFFLATGLHSGFGVADTHLLFSLTPTHAPTRHLVVADVVTATIQGVAPLVAGLLLSLALAGGVAIRPAYATLFAATAVLSLLSLVPLRHFQPGR